MDEQYYAVIMAGGGGTRLWPLSRKKTPKQMLRLTEQRSLFQIAIDRLKHLFSPEHIIVVTVADQADILKEQSPIIPDKNYILEPQPRGTASVVGLAAKVIQQRNPNSIMAVLTADHFIANEKKFHQLLTSAYQVALDDYLVTLGIQPTFPSTGYGYIHRGEIIGEYAGYQAHRVIAFKEKPGEELAKKFIQQNDHDWNSGMFIWRVERIIEEIHLWMPDLMDSLEKISQSWTTDGMESVDPNIWSSIHPQTIDYGIMEKAKKVAVIPAIDLGWNDVGSWDSLFEVIPPDENGNIIINTIHDSFDTHNSLVCSDQTQRLIVTIGLNNIVIVDTEDALLICDRNDSQKVRKMVDLLEKNNKSQYL